MKIRQGPRKTREGGAKTREGRTKIREGFTRSREGRPKIREGAEKFDVSDGVLKVAGVAEFGADFRDLLSGPHSPDYGSDGAIQWVILSRHGLPGPPLRPPRRARTVL